MNLQMYRVDAFASGTFAGNSAGVVPLNAWLPDEKLLEITREIGAPNTAFFVPAAGGDGYDLRWMTAVAEVPLCGHATLGTAHVLTNEMGAEADELHFHTRSGRLVVKRDGYVYAMDFPGDMPRAAIGEVAELERAFAAAIGRDIQEFLVTDKAVVCILGSEAEVRAVEYSAAMDEALTTSGRWGLAVSAQGDEGGPFDFVSRFFAPLMGVSEDSVTGSMHCFLAPYWAKRLGKTGLLACQASARGGEVGCKVQGDRVVLFGSAVTSGKGTISV